MSDPRQLDFEEIKLDIECGKYDHLACYCVIHEQIEALKLRLGPHYFNLFVKKLCNACTVRPTKPTVAPNQPTPIGPAGFEPPPTPVPVTPTPRPTPTPRSQVCPLPTADEVRGRQV